MHSNCIIRKATTQDKGELFDLMWYCFKEPMVNYKYEESIYKPDEFLLVENEDKTIAASIKICPFKMFYGDHSVPVGGIALVSSRPDFRYSGNMGNLITATIRSMYNDGMVFSPLAPFSYSFYRNYGWEITYDRQFYTIGVSKLTGFNTNNFTYKLMSLNDYQDQFKLKNQYFQNYAGAIKVNLQDMTNLAALYQIKGYELAIIQENGVTMGYLVYKIDGRTMKVQEYVGLTSRTDRAFLNYLHNHNAQIDTAIITLPLEHTLRYTLDEPRFPIDYASDMMTRIIDVKKAMELNTYDPSITTSMIFDIADLYGPWNTGQWLMQFENGCCVATKLDASNIGAYQSLIKHSISIQTLSQMLLGYLSVGKLHHLGKLKNPSTDLIRLFPERITYMNQRI